MNNHRLRMLQTALVVLGEAADRVDEYVGLALDPPPSRDTLEVLAGTNGTELLGDLDDALEIYLGCRNEFAEQQGLDLAELLLDRAADTFFGLSEGKP